MDETLSYYLDIQSLARLTRSKRSNKGLRKIAQECRISASTLSRVEREQVPDISSFLALCDWLEVSPASLFKKAEKQQRCERFSEQEAVALSGMASLAPTPEGELPLSKAEQLALRVRADSRLDPATANVLAVLIKAAYALSAKVED